jgi:oxygen-independent coproporphyrinogen-3 oxidase
MYWGASPSEQQWLSSLDSTLSHSDASTSLYVHIPFCQSLCTFCGCNMRLVRNHALAAPYVATVLQEFALYRQRLTSGALRVGELHLGGGSPTYLPADALDRLLDGILQHCNVSAAHDFAIEADPRNTTHEQLTVLRKHGFNRISFGVQDFDPRVQDIVNRVQPESQVRSVVDNARTLGFTSVAVDLIYGLPLQTVDSLNATMDAVERLRPDRISFLPYAHVPWIKPSQRRYTEADLPEGDSRQKLFELGRERLRAAGFVDIGLDQYAQAHDILADALRTGTLHRNFMGFTATRTQALIGLGVSAIGDAGTAYAQNEKSLLQYETRVQSGVLPLQRGHVLSATDLRLRHHIWNLLTGSRTEIAAEDEMAPWWSVAGARIGALQADGLVQRTGRTVTVTETGRSLLRTVCGVFDVQSQTLESRAAS